MAILDAELFVLFEILEKNADSAYKIYCKW